MPPIPRLSPTHDAVKTVSPAEMAKLLDAIPLENRPRVGSNARAGYLTGKFLHQLPDGELVGCDIFSESNYEAAFEIMAKERPARSLLPAQSSPRDFGDEVVDELRSQRWVGLLDDIKPEPNKSPPTPARGTHGQQRDFGDEVADEFVKNFGHGKACR
jgi:hypothetical protein